MFPLDVFVGMSGENPYIVFPVLFMFFFFFFFFLALPGCETGSYLRDAVEEGSTEAVAYLPD